MLVSALDLLLSKLPERLVDTTSFTGPQRAKGAGVCVGWGGWLLDLREESWAVALVPEGKVEA